MSDVGQIAITIGFSWRSLRLRGSWHFLIAAIPRKDSENTLYHLHVHIWAKSQISCELQSYSRTESRIPAIAMRNSETPPWPIFWMPGMRGSQRFWSFQAKSWRINSNLADLSGIFVEWASNGEIIELLDFIGNWVCWFIDDMISSSTMIFYDRFFGCVWQPKMVSEIGIQGLGVMSPGQVPQNMLYLKALIGAVLKKVDTYMAFLWVFKAIESQSQTFLSFFKPDSTI